MALHLRLTLRYFDELFCFLWHNIGYRIRDLIQNSFIFKKVRTESQSERDLKIAGSDLNRTKENEARPKAWSTQTGANKEQSRENSKRKPTLAFLWWSEDLSECNMQKECSNKHSFTASSLH